MMASGDGSVSLWKYHYPDQRKIKVSIAAGACLAMVGGTLLEYVARTWAQAATCCAYRLLPQRDMRCADADRLQASRAAAQLAAVL